MTYAFVILLFVAAWGYYCAWRRGKELKTWAEWAHYGRIVIAYKRKIKLNAPLTEFVAWAHMLKDDEGSKGRVIWAMGGASVAIAKSAVPPKPKRFDLARLRRARSSDSGNSVATTEGKFKATDETPKENHVKAAS